MKKIFVIAFIIFTTQVGFAQSKITWEKNIEITASSFQGKVPNLAEDNMQEYSFATTYEFSFQMMNMQFAFTKNFNSYVNAYYTPSLSWLEDGELTDQILLMANLDFDLAELYARKFRKRMFEAKGVGSNVNFFNSIHDEINRQHHDHHSVYQSEVRSNEDPIAYLNNEIIEINKEIEALSEYCKTCKPKKKKKKKG